MTHRERRPRTLASAAGTALLLLAAGGTAHGQSPRWGLLASARWSHQPMKGVYFFPGEGACQASDRDGGPPGPHATIPNDAVWPCHLAIPGWWFNSKHYSYAPTDPRDLHWHDDVANRTWAVNQIASTGANVIVMSRWGPHVNNGAPMQGTLESNDQLFDAVARTRNVLIMPAVDTFTKGCRDFRTDFPSIPSDPAPQLLAEVEDVVRRYHSNQSHPEWRAAWAQMWDRDGNARYAIHWIHAASTYNNDGCEFAQGLDWIAERVLQRYGARIGFTIDPFNAYQDNHAPNFNCDVGYCPAPENQCLQRAHSFLGIQGFNSELVRPGDRAPYRPVPPDPWAGRWASPPAVANDRIHQVIRWKRDWIQRWIDTGLPVIFDVSPGYDGRYVFGSGVIYGDNVDGFSDGWRNGQSALKGLGMKGTVYNAWNGYTEGLVATPGVWVKPQNTRLGDGRPPDGLKNWLTDYFRVDPRQCDHTHWADFGRVKHHVYGAICRKWQAMDADIGALGAPAGSEGAGCAGRRRTPFQFGAIVHGGHGTFATYGLIGALYRTLGYDCGWLGAPVSDEKPCAARCAGGRASDFENGSIEWCPGWTAARAVRGRSGC
ncbi:MAG TPA: hypothetical protein VIG50_11290 [Vicinamibacteria bacterium]